MTNVKTKDNLSSDELAFAVFCIENLASCLKQDVKEVYTVLTEKSDILYGYVIPCYETLHTQDKEYILDDIIDVMKARGVLE